MYINHDVLQFWQCCSRLKHEPDSKKGNNLKLKSRFFYDTLETWLSSRWNTGGGKRENCDPES